MDKVVMGGVKIAAKDVLNVLVPKMCTREAKLVIFRGIFTRLNKGLIKADTVFDEKFIRSCYNTDAFYVSDGTGCMTLDKNGELDNTIGFIYKLRDVKAQL